MGLASRGGGNEYLPTGAANTQKEQLASAGANDLSQQQFGVEQYSQDVGRKNREQAGAGLQALSGDYNPNAIASGASSATGSAYDMEKQNSMQAYQQFDAIASGIGELGKAASGGVSAGAYAMNAASGIKPPSAG